MMDMWGLFDHASRNELEQAVHRSYENYGLTGQFELEKYDGIVWNAMVWICYSWNIH